MRATVPLRRIATMTYGDALASDRRLDGEIPVMSSGGVSGSHVLANTQAPVIVVGRKGSHGSIWWSSRPSFVIDTAFYIDGRNTSAELRWLYYVLKTLNLDVLSNDVGVPGLGREVAYQAQVPVEDLAEQRRIADFLDDRVLRIDQIITARRQQSDRVHELEQAELTHVLWSPGDELSALRRHGVSVTTGPFGTVFSAADYVDDGIPMVNPTHIKRGAIISDPSHSVSRDTQRRLARHILRTNDLVMSRKGDIGHTAKVRQDQAGWICGSDSIAIHAEGSSIKPEFLDLFLKLTRARGQLIAHSNAATMPSLNEGNLLSLRVPFVNPREQEDRIAAGARIQRAASAGVENLQRSAELLSDYKQALITAAVTGELDVTTAGSGIPG